MKKIIFLLIAIIGILSSCKKSQEDIVKELLAEKIKNTLLFPDSYDPVTTVIDSFATPFDDPKSIKQIAKVQTLFDEAETLEHTVQINKSMYDSYAESGIGYLGNHEKQEYLRAQTDYNTKLDEAEKAKKKILDKLYGDRTFFGYLIDHTYRAKNNAGNTLMGRVMVVVDKDYNFLYAYDYDDEDFVLFYKFMENLQNEKEESEE